MAGSGNSNDVNLRINFFVLKSLFDAIGNLDCVLDFSGYTLLRQYSQNKNKKSFHMACFFSSSTLFGFV